MAYNPFNIFRRNQKALFAVLTVFVMIVFTLSSGVAGGDFFESFARWLGSRGTRGEAVCRIDGRTIYESDLDRTLQTQRLMANRFMFNAALQTTSALLEYANSQSSRLSEPGKMMATAARRALTSLEQMSSPEFRNNPQLMQLILPQLLQQVQQAEQLIDTTLDSPATKSEDKDVARVYRTIFNLRRQLQQSGQEREHYFINAPNRHRRDQIEFLLWLNKAEQLGIRYTRADVDRLIQREFYGFFKSDVDVRRLLQQTMPGFTMEKCMEALAREFQVRTAQTAVLGYSGRFHSAPAYPTPYEAFEFYRDQCSPTVYEVIPVPASAFLDKVTGTPSDNEIRDLFRKYENDEPNPRNETPGFKEPRKIRVAWLGITGDEPYYKTLATEQIRIGEVMAKASGMLTVPVPGALDTWALAAVAPLSLKEPAITAAYNRYREQFNFQLRNAYHDEQVLVRDLLPSSVVRPGVLAATVGGWVGQTAGAGNPITALAVSLAAPIGYEIRDRVKVGMPLVLGTIPSPGALGTTLSGAVTAQALLPQPLPIESKRAELLQETIDARARALAFGEEPRPGEFNSTRPREKGDIARFIDELKKLANDGRPKDNDKQAAENYIRQFITTRGLTRFGASTEPRDEWSLEDDPGLQELVEAHRKSVVLAKLQAAHGGVEPYFPFGQSFFWKTEFSLGGTLRSPTSGLYLAETFPPRARDDRDGDPRYVVWRTEDIAPKKMNVTTARDAVIAAWKRMEARKLARQYAHQLADAIRAYEKSDPYFLGQFLADKAFAFQRDITHPKALQRARKFRISDVAPWVSRPFLGGLRPFELPESENIPYPTPQMRQALLDNRDKPAKTVLVLPDAPQDTFYVATLIERTLKTPSDFKDNVYSRTGNAQQILALHRDEVIKRSRSSVIDLLKREFRYEETDEQKKKLDDNAQTGNRNWD
ncbi:MAG: hypothetical protein RMJ56_04715 [Gemmataceae bacterium]|nr:hypothetical protein [Gemmata sp.]MDW8196891.1 hypothetical protein [Gemmataceae bacterium]